MGRHVCRNKYIDDGYRFPNDYYGNAIEKCVEREDGTLWVDNSEYATRVNYCPFCGYRAKAPVTDDPSDAVKEIEALRAALTEIQARLNAVSKIAAKYIARTAKLEATDDTRDAA